MLNMGRAIMNDVKDSKWKHVPQQSRTDIYHPALSTYANGTMTVI